MSDKTEVEIVIVMDSDGEYAVGCSREHAIERFDEEIGGDKSRRVVKLLAYMAPPAAEDEDGLTIDIPDSAGTTETHVEVAAE